MFRVEWLQSALNDLADAWMRGDAARREAINIAVRGIDFRLERNPQAEGESRDHRSRVTFVAPLAVIFEVDTVNSIVLVHHVWTFRRRG
jgi:hypothetical protein